MRTRGITTGVLSLVAAGAIGGGFAIAMSGGQDSPARPVELHQVADTSTATETATATTTATPSATTTTSTATPTTRAPRPAATHSTPKVATPHVVSTAPSEVTPAPARTIPRPPPGAPATRGAPADSPHARPTERHDNDHSNRQHRDALFEARVGETTFVNVEQDPATTAPYVAVWGSGETLTTEQAVTMAAPSWRRSASHGATR